MDKVKAAVLDVGVALDAAAGVAEVAAVPLQGAVMPAEEMQQLQRKCRLRTVTFSIFSGRSCLQHGEHTKQQ
jgi:hypothetical protein